jgi:hypothetical protein
MVFHFRTHYLLTIACVGAGDMFGWKADAQRGAGRNIGVEK